MKAFVVSILAAVVLSVASAAQAQVILNATQVEVTASPDHNVTELGSALVSSYRLTYRDGTTVIGTPQNAGKPTPNAAGKFDVAIPANVLAVKNKPITVTVEILGPGGPATDPVSDPFGSLGPPRGSGTKPLPKP